MSETQSPLTRILWGVAVVMTGVVVWFVQVAMSNMKSDISEMRNDLRQFREVQLSATARVEVFEAALAEVKRDVHRLEMIITKESK